MTERPNDPAWSAPPPDSAADPERLAALLDDRLSGADRDELLARLGGSDEDLALFADAVAIQRELEEEDAAAAVPGVLPLRRPARPARVLDRRWLAAAAVLAGVTLLPFAWRASQGGAVRVPSHAVAMLENPSAGLPEGWTDSIAWSSTRGGSGGSRTEPLPSSLDAVAERRLSVHLGAYMVDLDLAIRAGDADNTRILAARAAELLNGVSAGGIAASQFTALTSLAGGPPAEVLPVFERASKDAASYVDADLFALAAWAEAARLAARRRDAAFFREAGTRRMIARAEELVGGDDRAGTAITAIRASLEPESPQWPQLVQATNDLLAAIG